MFLRTWPGRVANTLTPQRHAVYKGAEGPILGPLTHRGRGLSHGLWLGITACILIFASTIQGQTPPRPADVVFQNLNRDDGLPSPIVQAIAQDGDGFIWAGTGSGVSRWDGYRFRNYQFQVGNPHSLPDNDIFSMYTDPGGTLWIGTRSRGVVRYDPAHDDFQTFDPAGKNRNASTIYAMLTDGHGGLWVGLRSGVDHLNPATGEFKPVRFDGISGPAPTVTLVRDSSGRIWAGTARGLFRSDAGVTHFTQQNIFGQTKALVWKLLFDHAGRLWIGTLAGAWVLEPSAQQATPIHETTQGPAILDHAAVDTICEIAPGAIWLGTLGEGIVAVDAQTLQTHRITHDPAYPTSLPSDSVVALLRDKEGNVWAATTEGVARTFPGSGILTFFGATGLPGQADRVPDTDITQVLAAPGGHLWLGLNTNGVELVSLSGANLQVLRHISAGVGSPLPVGQINGMAAAPDGTTYIGTANWVYRVDPNGRGLTALPRAESGIHVDALVWAHGTLWIGSHRGLWKTDGWHTRKPPEPVSLPLTSPEITFMSQGADNDLWIATANELVHYDIATNKAERIPVNPSDPAGLPAPVTSMLIDREHRFWVTTAGAGVSLLLGRDAQGKPRFRTFLQGIPNTTGDDILQAPNGQLWVSTDDGFAVIDPRTFAIQALHRTDGIAITAYWVKSGALTRDGRLVFGGDGGLTVIDPSAVHPWLYQAPVVITDLRAGGKLVPFDLFNQPGASTVLRLRHDANNVEVGFAALDYTGSNRERYEYKLEGFDHAWVSAAATRRVASYTNLPPGAYTLELRGSNRDGLWGPVRRLSIVVVPAWYETWWARTGGVVLLLLLLVLAYRYSTAYQRARHRELERRVEERTAELRKTTEALEESRRLLEMMAHSDSLTGLPNRRMFSDYFRRLLASAKRHENSTFTVFLFDLDKFKEINDAWGHDAGDAWLKSVADRINAVMRQSDCFARVGGDEFAILVADPIDADGIATLCDLLASTVRDPLPLDQAVLTTTLSIGVATYPQDGTDEVTLFKSADVALYRVKRAGGNGWQRHSDANESASSFSGPAIS